MLIVQVVTVHQAYPAKVEFFRRLIHTITAFADPATKKFDGTFYLGASPSRAKDWLSAIGISDARQLEQKYEKASNYRAVSDDEKVGQWVLEAVAYSVGGNTGMTEKEIAEYDPPFTPGRKNRPIAFRASFDNFLGFNTSAKNRIATALRISPNDLQSVAQALGYPYGEGYSEYIRFLRNHCQNFEAEIKYERFPVNIEEVLTLQIPVFE